MPQETKRHERNLIHFHSTDRHNSSDCLHDKEDGREIARLLEVAEEDDGTKTARILDFSRVLYAEEHFPTLRKIVSFYQLDADNIELYHRNRYKRRYTAMKAVYRFRLVRTIQRKDLYEGQ